MQHAAAPDQTAVAGGLAWVMVHGATDLALACAAAAPPGDLAILSAPGAAGSLGALWWQALIDRARHAHPALRIADLLDCGAAPGRVQEALHCGLRHLILAPCPAFAALAALTASLGGVLLDAAPPCLDLADPKSRRHLAAWLAGQSIRPV